MHIFLVGPPGIGKSSVAPALAHHFGAAVIELDREIQRRAGKPNKDLIEQEGMDRFRDVESSVLKGLARTPSWVVVARGGGAAGPERPCHVLIRAGVLDHVGPHLADLGWRGQVAVVSDAQTAARYEPDLLRSLASVGLKAVTLRVPAGERGKQFAIAARLWAS